tara:strand:- start:405 stop:1028 length:624 start_codon:yes stop_codon:yes gene_type:complete
MSFPTTDAQGELQAVNQILASVGQAPVTTLEQTNPDVAIAYNTLQQVSREVQAEGWTFNKEYHYPLKPNTDQEFKIPDNMLQMDLCMDELYNRDKDPIRRDGKLYDRNSHSFKWEEDKTHYFDIIWFFEWSDLPPTIRDYITSRAASIVSMRIVGDPNLYQILAQQEAYMRSNALQYETEQGDYTFFGHPRGGDYYNSYQPFHALYR